MPTITKEAFASTLAAGAGRDVTVRYVDEIKIAPRLGGTLPNGKPDPMEPEDDGTVTPAHVVVIDGLTRHHIDVQPRGADKPRTDAELQAIAAALLAPQPPIVRKGLPMVIGQTRSAPVRTRPTPPAMPGDSAKRVKPAKEIAAISKAGIAPSRATLPVVDAATKLATRKAAHDEARKRLASSRR